MKFGPTAVCDAEGTILAHSLATSNGRIKKGHILTASDIVDLRSAGFEKITVAKLDNLDVLEDVAASQIADQLVGTYFYAAEAFTGRVNLHAKVSGVLSANPNVVDRINRICPAITMATLADGSFVEAGRMVATVKIISFAVEQHFLSLALSLASAEVALCLAPSKPHKVGLIATQRPLLKSSVMDKTAATLEKRLSTAGSSLIWEKRIAHDEHALADALAQESEHVDIIIIFGASAITDPEDVLPKGVRLAGADIVHVGMPVDPGNLLMTARLGDVPIIGAPGCARSPAENGFDWVLQRLLAGLTVDAHYVTGLGVGGLLMEITDRPQPREPELYVD